MAKEHVDKRKERLINELINGAAVCVGEGGDHNSDSDVLFDSIKAVIGKFELGKWTHWGDEMSEDYVLIDAADAKSILECLNEASFDESEIVKIHFMEALEFKLEMIDYFMKKLNRHSHNSHRSNMDEEEYFYSEYEKQEGYESESEEEDSDSEEEEDSDSEYEEVSTKKKKKRKPARKEKEKKEKRVKREPTDAHQLYDNLTHFIDGALCRSAVPSLERLARLEKANSEIVVRGSYSEGQSAVIYMQRYVEDMIGHAKKMCDIESGKEISHAQKFIDMLRELVRLDKTKREGEISVNAELQIKREGEIKINIKIEGEGQTNGSDGGGEPVPQGAHRAHKSRANAEVMVKKEGGEPAKEEEERQGSSDLVILVINRVQ